MGSLETPGIDMMKRKMGEGGWNGNNKHNAMLTVVGEGAGTIRRLQVEGYQMWEDEM